MTGTLKVTPDRLISASSDFARHDSSVQNLTQQMMSIVNGLTSVWEGQAQQTYAGRFKSLQSDMDKIHAKIAEHAKDLTEMAQNYEKAEQTNTQNIGGLNISFI